MYGTLKIVRDNVLSGKYVNYSNLSYHPHKRIRIIELHNKKVKYVSYILYQNISCIKYSVLCGSSDQITVCLIYFLLAFMLTKTLFARRVI